MGLCPVVCTWRCGLTITPFSLWPSQRSVNYLIFLKKLPFCFCVHSTFAEEQVSGLANQRKWLALGDGGKRHRELLEGWAHLYFDVGGAYMTVYIC